jgi:alkanesulfonate monooxygenase SsuD/methylene tetrahydromethanopterin reductase-like flavin-dependent oxidoreductase (luciferase family)
MRLGCSLPVSDIGTGPGILRDYAQATEQLGYAHLVAPDHVLGANPATDHGERRVGTTASAYHDPIALFGFLAGCTQQIGFAVGVLILAQWQAVLVAKQAASWTYCAAAGSDWASASAGTRSSSSASTRISIAGAAARRSRCRSCRRCGPNRMSASTANSIISKTPASICGRVPIWFGGHAEATFRRAAKYGDGFMPLAYPAGEAALAAFAKLRGLTQEAGRDPVAMGLEVWVSPGTGTEADWRREIAFWKEAGVTHLTAHTTYVSGHHKRIAGRTASGHLAAITRYRAAVADLL